jgi:hypothetical protein
MAMNFDWVALRSQIHCSDFERLFRAPCPTAVMEGARLVFFMAVWVAGCDRGFFLNEIRGFLTPGMR